MQDGPGRRRQLSQQVIGAQRAGRAVWVLREGNRGSKFPCPVGAQWPVRALREGNRGLQCHCPTLRGCRETRVLPCLAILGKQASHSLPMHASLLPLPCLAVGSCSLARLVLLDDVCCFAVRVFLPVLSVVLMYGFEWIALFAVFANAWCVL